MTLSLELKFMPEYKKTLGSKLGQDDIELLNRVNECKIICNEISQYFDKSLEEASLCWFQILLDRTQERIEGSNFFDEGFSEIFKKDVIAPHVSFGTYDSEMFETHFEIDDPDEDSYDEFLDLYADMYQGGSRSCTKLPTLILKNSYVIERKTGIKLRISKQAIARMGVKLNRLWGFRCHDCSNFESLHAIKN
jgi:hypothetical protein